MSRKNRVLIVGGGSLGRWHVKGLETANVPVRVDLVDINPNAISQAHTYIENGVIDAEKVKLQTWSDLASCLQDAHKDYSLVIISTPAVERLKLFQRILGTVNSDAVILEKPLEQSAEAIDVMELAGVGKKVYVNHPRRLMAWHKLIYKRLHGSGPFDCVVNLPSLGIACNVSHYIDLINWWTGEFPISVCTGGLFKNWVETKRPGFFEVQGELKISFDHGSSLKIRTHSQPESADIHITNHSSASCIIYESVGKAVFDDGEVLEGQVIPQSKLTGLVLKSIQETGGCDLTEISVAARCNKLATSALLNHWNKFEQGPDRTSAPIT